MPHTMLIDSLHAVRRRVKFLSVAYGAGIVLAAAAALVFVTVLLDYLLNLPAFPRVIVICLALVGIGYFLFHYVVRPGLARLSLSDVAGHLENRFPTFQDSLRSTVDFVGGSVPGSEAMKDRTVEEASRVAGTVNLRSAVATTPVWYSMAGGVGAVVLGVLLLSVMHVPYARFLPPFPDQPWPKRVEISLLGSVPARVPVGQRVDVRMKLAKGDKASMKAIVYYQYDNGPVQQEYMSRGEDGAYSASLDAKITSAAAATNPSKAMGSLKVWMKAGDDRKELAPITVVPRLAIRSVDAVITPPAYAHAGPQTLSLANAPAVMTSGADLALKVAFNKPLAADQAIVIEPVAKEMKPPQPKWERQKLADGVDAAVATGHWSVRESLRFHIKATDADGFQNTGLEEFELIVRPDQSPAVQIELPRGNQERTPVASFPVQIAAEDDYGIDSLKLVIDRLGDKKHWEIPLVAGSEAVSPAQWTRVEGTAERQRFRSSYVWDLAASLGADLKPGDVLEYYALAQDNFELDGTRHPPVPSGRLRVTIISQEDLTRIVADEMRTLATLLNEVRNSQNRTKEETGNVARDTEKKPDLDAGDRQALDRLANQQSAAASSAKSMAAKLEQINQRLDENKSPAQELRDIAKDVKNALNHAAENPMKESANKLNQVKNSRPNTQNNNQSNRNQNNQNQNNQNQNQNAQQNSQQNQQNAQSKEGQNQQNQSQANRQNPGENKPGDDKNNPDKKDQGKQDDQAKADEQAKQDQQAKNDKDNKQENQGPAGQRNQDLKDAQQNQQQASNELEKALDKMGNLGGLQRTMDQLKDLLKQQQKVSQETKESGKNNLGKKPEEMNEQDRKKLEQAAQDQQNLSKKTDKAMKEMEKLAEQMSKSDPNSSEAMKNAAQTGQQQKVVPNQQKASDQAKQNQQDQAQAAQKQAELGLEMMINELRAAERRKLEELARKLEDLQKQLEILIRRQAGHNLDNLGLQGNGKIAALDAQTRDELIAKSERFKDQPTTVENLPQLSTGQEQTERNTRDIAKVAEDLPNGAEPATHLTRAAGKMERAIVSLRESKLAPAYDPSQVEALAALEEAKKIVDKQQEEIAQKKEEQQKEAIRQVYMKIKGEQEKLNTETARVEKNRNADGSLNRADGVLLGQMPGQQGKLSERTAKLDEDLAALGSIVYTWANKDIVDSMNTSKDDLGKADTGEATQTEQKRIVAQLDAMIKNLAIKPPEPEKFASRQNGGGQGQGQQGKKAPPLPPEVELRLLKDLQTAVNESTKVLDAMTNKDKPKLLALGNRQGELRNLLDNLLQKASEGKVKLGPEPDNKDQLPEEAQAKKDNIKEGVENQELEKELLTGDPTAEKVEKDTSLIGDRMARSRQRLAMNNDPGAVTQEIQKRIILDMDDLIRMARTQQARGRGQKNPQLAQLQRQPGQRQDQQPANQGRQPNQPNQAQNPAQVSQIKGQDNTNADLSKEMTSAMDEWGKVTPRLRGPILEGQSEKPIEKYQRLINDYYRSLATKANERQ